MKEMSNLGHIEAEQGWLELGNHVEANEELEKIAARNRAHPELDFAGWANQSGMMSLCI